MWAGYWERNRGTRVDESTTEVQNNSLESQTVLLGELFVLNASSTANTDFLQGSVYFMSFK